MATLAVTTIAASGTAQPTPVAAAGGGDQLAWGNTTRLVVINGSGSSVTVTVAAQIACDQGSLHNIVNAVPAGATEIMGPFLERYKDANGYVQVAYSSATDVTVYAFQ